MLTLEVHATPDQSDDVVDVLARHPGVEHVLRLGMTVPDGMVLVTAHVQVDVVDSLLRRLRTFGVDGDDLTVVHRDSRRPLGSLARGHIPSWSGGGLAAVELTMESRQYARIVPLYLAVMACAGVIAVFGLFTGNTIAIVGAMAISPDLFPICATCVGVVDRRLRLGMRAFLTLTVGLATTSAMALLTSLLLRWGGYAPANGSLGDAGMGILPSVNVATVGIAIAAGVAGILSFESRSSSAVGVAISITTVPAAAFIGAAIAVGDPPGATGALAVLAVNVAVLVVVGSLTMLAQRRWQAGHHRSDSRTTTRS